MKTFLIVTLYTGMVAALDLGGVVWNQLCAPRPAKAGVAVATPAVAPAKGGSANSAVVTNPSDT